MFNQKSEGAESDIETLVGPDSKITGDIRFRSGLHVDGAIDGGVFADGPGTLVVSSQGRIKGRIEVPKVILDGSVEGDVIASERIELRANARVTGNIEYGSIQMVLGAKVDGKLAFLPRPAKGGQR